MSKHTPGHWMAVGHWIEHTDDDVPDIANFDPASMGQEGRSDKEILANVRLCAMAPAMLTTLKLLYAAVDSGRVARQVAAMEIAALVIAQATGEPS